MKAALPMIWVVLLNCAIPANVVQIAVVGEAEFIEWVAAYANEHAKPPARGLVTGKPGESASSGPDVRRRGECGEVSSLREVFS